MDKGMTYEKCRQIREVLVAFLDDELPRDMSLGIQEHIDLCEPCARMARAEQRFTQTLKTRLCRIEAPAEFTQSMRKRLRDPESLAAPAVGDGGASRRSVLPRWGRWGYAAAAATLALAVLVPAMQMLAP